MAHRHAALGLLEGEVPKIGQNQCQLLPMVGAVRRLPGALDEDDSERLRGFAAERSDLIAQLIVGDEEPATVRWRGIELGEPAAEQLHTFATGNGQAQ